jgi:O-acetyl-ADP-ribose deacetylase (regulator of RNase III)
MDQSERRLFLLKSLESIAFCCISTGVFCFPNEDAAEIAAQSVCIDDDIGRVISSLLQ